jgi:hypothetical protein
MADDLLKPQDNLDAPALRAGPDTMRPGARGATGSGTPFIFLPTHELVLVDGVIGHETLLDDKFPGFHDMIAACFPDPKSYKHAEEETGYRGTPWVDHFALRRLMFQAGAIFGRVGSIQRQGVIALWPGTENLSAHLPACLKALIARNRAAPTDIVSLGNNPIAPAGELLRRVGMDKAERANKAAGTLGVTYPSAVEIKRWRERDKAAAELGHQPFQYTYRYGEGFKSFFISETERSYPR